jgi:hypothetical protein
MNEAPAKCRGFLLSECTVGVTGCLRAAAPRGFGLGVDENLKFA